MDHLQRRGLSLAAAILVAGCNQTPDIVTVRLRGRLAKGVRYSAPGAELRARAFYVRVNLSAVRPDYESGRIARWTSSAWGSSSPT